MSTTRNFQRPSTMDSLDSKYAILLPVISNQKYPLNSSELEYEKKSVFQTSKRHFRASVNSSINSMAIQSTADYDYPLPADTRKVKHRFRVSSQMTERGALTS